MSETTTVLETKLALALVDAELSNATGKKWYASKTLWANLIAAVAIAIQLKYGYIVDPAYQALALTAVNSVLRKITSEPIVF